MARAIEGVSRSILGFMNDSALACRTAVEHAGGLEHIDLDPLNRYLRRQLHNRAATASHSILSSST